jgi:hypothetical protein
MASLGVFYLLFVAPLITAGAALNLRNRRALSGFHRSAYIASIAYSGLMLMALGGWFGAHFWPGRQYFKRRHYQNSNGETTAPGCSLASAEFARICDVARFGLTTSSYA